MQLFRADYREPTMSYATDPGVERALLAMFQQIIANNRAGGWRALGRQP